MGVDLCCLDVGVTEHLADGVDVGAVGELQGGESVTEAVECDVTVDAGGFNPFL